MRNITDFILRQINNKNDVLAIYLTGSRNNSLHTESSDYDFVVVKRPTLDSLLGNYSKPKHTTSESYDYRVYDLVWFLNRTIVQSIYNDTEVLWNEPVYMHKDYLGIKSILDQHKNNLIDKSKILSSLLGSLSEIRHKIFNISGKVDLNRVKFNKEVANFFRYELQMQKLIKEDTFYVSFKKEDREEFLKMKQEYPDKYYDPKVVDILEKEKLEDRFNRLVELKENYRSKEVDVKVIRKEIIQEILKLV